MKAARWFLLMCTLTAIVGGGMASADEFTATSYPATIEGATDSGFTNEFVTTAGTIKCKKISHQGTLKEKSTAISITSAYEECVAFGFPVTFDTNGCEYLFRVTGGTSTSGTVDLVCPQGKEVTVTATSGATLKCNVHVPPQSNLEKVTYSNIGALGSTEEVTVTANLTGLKYTHTAGIGLGACLSGSATNGSLVAKATMTGAADGGGGHVGLLLSNA